MAESVPKLINKLQENLLGARLIGEKMNVKVFEELLR